MTLRELRAEYQKGKNITQLLKEQYGTDNNSPEIIEASYELQAGSYTRAHSKESRAIYNQKYTSEIARTILELDQPGSILEAGVGEATTLSGVLSNIPSPVKSYGFDLSWSRLAYARSWLKKHNQNKTTLVTGNLFNIPFADNSIDIVYTSHSIEPNGGHEEEILAELLRVTRNYLVLLEPGYELASEEAQRRMEHHGYCKGLKQAAESLGAKVICHDLFPYTANPLNPTALTIIEKNTKASRPSEPLACPIFKTPLIHAKGVMFSTEALMAYPIIDGIPCLRQENAVLATHFEDFLDE